MLMNDLEKPNETVEQKKHTNLLFLSAKQTFSIDKVNINHVQDDDYDAVEKLRQAHLNEEGVNSSPIGNNLKQYSLNNNVKRFNVMAAKFGHKIIAYVIYSFQYSSLNDNCSLYISDLYVSPEYRKQGIGKKIIEQLSSHDDCYQLTWKALKTNVTAIQIYNKAGAVIDSENDRVIAFKLPSDRNKFKNRCHS